jgi:flagellar L-ring protein precursor FlgH
VGDVLTVQVVENSAASANTDTGTRRSNNNSVQVSRPKLGPVSVGLAVAGDFDGGGRTARAGNLLAQLSVTVREILPNGDLRVSGEQLLLINEEQQKIDLEGRVRPQDISDGNVVVSSRLADAKINYVGQGDLADRQKPAWWRKVVDWLGL